MTNPVHEEIVMALLRPGRFDVWADKLDISDDLRALLQAGGTLTQLRYRAAKRRYKQLRPPYDKLSVEDAMNQAGEEFHISKHTMTWIVEKM